MNIIEGKYGKATVFTDQIENTAMEQIKALCDQPFSENCKIAIMPDVHAGSGCVIGFTADLGPLADSGLYYAGCICRRDDYVAAGRQTPTPDQCDDCRRIGACNRHCILLSFGQ